MEISFMKCDFLFIHPLLLHSHHFSNTHLSIISKHDLQVRLKRDERDESVSNVNIIYYSPMFVYVMNTKKECEIKKNEKFSFHSSFISRTLSREFLIKKIDLHFSHFQKNKFHQLNYILNCPTSIISKMKFWNKMISQASEVHKKIIHCSTI